MPIDRRRIQYTANATQADRVLLAQRRIQRTRAKQQQAVASRRAAVKLAAFGTGQCP